MTDAQEIASLSFEQALAQLEKIVAELESGKTDLEQSIDAYERGARLKAHCEAKLKEAQLRVERIVIGPAGPAGVEPAEF
jgi:exodeoxyribonuclease VII small subunit